MAQFKITSYGTPLSIIKTLNKTDDLIVDLKTVTNNFKIKIIHSDNIPSGWNISCLIDDAIALEQNNANIMEIKNSIINHFIFILNNYFDVPITTILSVYKKNLLSMTNDNIEYIPLTINNLLNI